MRHLRLAIAVLVVIPAAFACEFRYDPIAAPQYYRAEGWKLPGARDFPPSAAVKTYGQPPEEAIPGAVAEILRHDESPNVVEFPAEEFVFKGARQRMRAAQVEAGIVRWMMHGHAVAYSYRLIPVVAHREKGRWVIDSEAACIYFATFVDDKGDGVYRVLVPGPFTADLVPSWAKPAKN
jgi:hypothetical protein